MHVGMNKSRFSTRMNRNSYAIFRLVPFPMTVTPNPDFMVTPLFNAEHLRNGLRYDHSNGMRIENPKLSNDTIFKDLE